MHLYAVSYDWVQRFTLMKIPTRAQDQGSWRISGNDSD